MIQRQKRRLLLPFLAPAVLLYGVFFLWPAFRTVLISFTSWAGVTMEMPFIGLGNYSALLNDPTVAVVARNTLTVIIVGGLATFPLALYFVMAAEGTGRRARWMRFLVIMPLALSVAAVALLWKFIYDPTFGLLNGFLHAVGLGGFAMPWLGDPNLALFAVIVTILWHGTGIWVMFLAAAVARVPQELKDCARTDGANGWQVFRYVTFPLIWDVTRVLLVLWIIEGSQTFLFSIAMTQGGPVGSTRVVGQYVYELAFREGRWAYAASLSVVFVVVVLALTALMSRLTRQEAVEYG